jgi:hypothetical protein
MFVACCLFSVDTNLPFIFNWESPEIRAAVSVNCWRLWEFGARVRSWGAGLQAVRTMRQQAVCRYATLVLWVVMHLGSGGVRDGLENTCYSTAVCLARGEGGCDFYADDLLLAGFLCYLTPCLCVCVAYVWNESRWFQVSLSALRFNGIRNWMPRIREMFDGVGTWPLFLQTIRCFIITHQLKGKKVMSEAFDWKPTA